MITIYLLQRKVQACVDAAFFSQPYKQACVHTLLLLFISKHVLTLLQIPTVVMC